MPDILTSTFWGQSKTALEKEYYRILCYKFYNCPSYDFSVRLKRVYKKRVTRKFIKGVTYYNFCTAAKLQKIVIFY